MTELLLKFTDENGDERRVPVETEKFAVGRHSENDLRISNEKLSRQHLKIERFGDIFVASDANSSNGTTLNDQPLDEPLPLKNGDLLNLGGGLEIEIELISDAEQNGGGTASPASGADESDTSSVETSTGAAGANAAVSAPNAASNAAAIPMSFFILAPVFGLLVISVLGAIAFVYSRSGSTDIGKKGDEFIYSTDSDDELEEDERSNKKTPEPTVKKQEQNSSETNTAAQTTPESNASSPPPQQTPKNLTDTAKIEANSASFLRRIAQNDPQAFLTSEQARLVESKIKSFGNSAALAENIKAAKANAAQIKQLAAAKNLKPQFLAVAALARIGSARGNVVQTAQTMTEVLEKLDTQLGSEFSSDALLVMAAYEQGAAGDFLKMRNMLQQMSNEYSESSRTIRSIWFLHKNGKISDAQYEFALRFLAIGTITQNPKDFGVNADELKLN